MKRHANDFSRALAELGPVFLKLGLTSFGGPAAHIGYIHGECVRRRAWVSETEYADLIALSQFLPGPGTSQLAFAIGLRRAGLIGAFTASIAFLVPSAVLMIAFGYAVHRMSLTGAPGWLQGLKAATVAVVAQAVLLMGRRLCPDWPRILFAAGGVALILALGTTWAQTLTILVGALFGCWLLPAPTDASLPAGSGAVSARSSVARGLALLAIWAALLLFLWPAGLHAGPPTHLAVFARFYRVGSLVFGGAHVVLPLLRAQVVPTGWTNDNLFLAGYGAAQALPGPMFSFAAFLGALIAPHPPRWLFGVIALLGIYLPGWLLMAGAVPFWDRLRAASTARSALAGANAAVVGVLGAALYQPVWVSGIHRPLHLVIAMAAFAALQFRTVPVWSVIAGSALAGVLLL